MAAFRSTKLQKASGTATERWPGCITLWRSSNKRSGRECLTATTAQKKHFSFSHLYTGLGYASGIANFIGLKEAGKDLENSPVPENKMEELGKLLVWIYGSKKQGKNPLVRSQNPDIRLLDKALQKKEGVDMLNGDHSLEDAADAVKGDRAMLRDHLLNAKGAMEKALGKIRGYGGDGELMRHAESVRDSASSLLHLMDRADRKKGGD